MASSYLSAVGLLRDYSDASQDPAFSQIVSLDLATVVPSLSGPKRPHDRVDAAKMKEDFLQCLSNKVSATEPERHRCPNFPHIILGLYSQKYLICGGLASVRKV